MPFAAVLDACVLVPAALRDILLRAAERGLYRPVWNRAILDELRAALCSKVNIPEARVAHLLRAFEEAFPEALVEEATELDPTPLAAPGDAHVVAAAIAGEAQVIVTINVRDFRSEALARLGVDLRTPDQFLQDLFRLDPGLMVEVLEGQAADLQNPPKSTAEVLQALRRWAPGFVEAVAEQLS